MSFIAVSAVVGTVATVAGVATQVSAANQSKKQFEAQAAYEKASTEKRVAEEQSRTSENLLRAQEEKRKELSKQRAAFVKAGVLPSSPSADFVIGELGENLQTRIQDVFTSANDRIASISSTGAANHFNALQNASAASRQRTGAILGGLTKLTTSGISAYRSGVIGTTTNTIRSATSGQ